MNHQIWLFLVVFTALYFISIIYYRLVLHPLAKFPGPALAAISRWFEAYYDVIQEGQYTFKIAELHKKYGKSVLCDRSMMLWLLRC